MSSILLQEPGARNSRVVPSASPVARPSKAPRYLSLGSIIIQWKDGALIKYASLERVVARLPVGILPVTSYFPLRSWYSLRIVGAMQRFHAKSVTSLYLSGTTY